MAKAVSGDRVLIHYRVRLSSGDIIDLSPDNEPLEIILGVGRYLSGIEDTVVGMEPGEERSVIMPAEEAFGPRIDDLVQEIGRDLFATEITPEVGQTFRMGDPEQGGMVLTVVAVDNDRIVVDANHPLAGEDLLVDVSLVGILPPDPDALLRYIKDAAENDPTADPDDEDACGCGCDHDDACLDDSDCGCKDDCDCEHHGGPDNADKN